MPVMISVRSLPKLEEVPNSMQLLRAFIFSRNSTGEWGVVTAREADTLAAAIHKAIAVYPGVALHVGFSRPPFTAFQSLFEIFPSAVLLTSAAKLSLGELAKTTHAPVGFAEEHEVFALISGLNYEIDHELLSSVRNYLAKESEQQSSPLPKTNNIAQNELLGAAQAHGGVINEQWWSEFREYFPADYELLSEQGATDDVSLTRNRAKVDQNALASAERFRFSYLMRGRDIFNPIDVAQAASPWLFPVRLLELEMTVRALNAFSAVGIHTIADLSRSRAGRFLKIQNLGAKSSRQAAEAIKDVMAIDPDRISPLRERFIFGNFIPASLESQTAPKTISPTSTEYSNESESTEDANTALLVIDSPNFISGLSKSLETINKKSSKILSMRMGLGCPPRTLQQIGDIFGITRERIRQIESKSSQKIRSLPIWTMALEAKIFEILGDRDLPLPINGLPTFDNWFEGVEGMDSVLEYAFSHFGSDSLHVIKSEGISYASRVSQVEFDAAVSMAKSLLEKNSGTGMKLDEVKLLASSTLPTYGSDLKEEVFRVASKFAKFSDDGDGDSILLSYGHGTEALVEAVLFESQTPLHFLDIKNRIKNDFSKDVDERRVHAACANVAKLFDRGSYGLDKHMPFTAQEAADILDTAEEVILSDDTDRQWHCAALIPEIIKIKPALSGQLDQYVLNIILANSGVLANLGRMVWRAGANESFNSANRIDIIQAADLALIDAGTPMSSRSIRKKISEQRGVGKSFQLREDGRLIRVGEGVWGLIDRDVSLGEIEIQSVLTELRWKLNKSEKAIHLSEIQALVNSVLPPPLRNPDPTLIMSLACKSGEFRAFHGGYLGLKTWQATNRLSMREAAVLAIQQAGKEYVPTAELRELVSRNLGREVGTTFSLSMNSAGLAWSESHKGWALKTESCDDGMDDFDED